MIKTISETKQQIRFVKHKHIEYINRMGKDLSPPSTASTTTTSENLHMYSLKISSMSNPGGEFHEPELIFNAKKR